MHWPTKCALNYSANSGNYSFPKSLLCWHWNIIMISCCIPNKYIVNSIFVAFHALVYASFPPLWLNPAWKMESEVYNVYKFLKTCNAVRLLFLLALRATEKNAFWRALITKFLSNFMAGEEIWVWLRRPSMSFCQITEISLSWSWNVALQSRK
jgi:hypothetical protein